MQRGLERGKSLGVIEGSRRKALETAKVFKSMGLPITTIAHGTGLSEHEIEKL